jgi:hypothetical protein
MRQGSNLSRRALLAACLRPLPQEEIYFGICERSLGFSNVVINDLFHLGKSREKQDPNA